MKIDLRIPGLDSKPKKSIPHANIIVDSDASSENLVTGNTGTMLSAFNLYKAFAGTAYLSLAATLKHVGIYGGIIGLAV